MPLYNFKCSQCKEEKERLAKLSQDEINCSCGGVAIRVFTANKAIFQVNGAGAYNSGVMKSK